MPGFDSISEHAIAEDDDEGGGDIPLTLPVRLVKCGEYQPGPTKRGEYQPGFTEHGELEG